MFGIHSLDLSCDGNFNAGYSSMSGRCQRAGTKSSHPASYPKRKGMCMVGIRANGPQFDSFENGRKGKTPLRMPKPFSKKEETPDKNRS